jgi:ATP-binding cassette subfamily C (CFTR/MRP) protein 4
LRARVLVEDNSEAIIQNMNFSLKPGDLMVVVGQVGAGKTTLLCSLMEETKLCKGETRIQGTIAYVEQEPFIFSGTIKDNILFGKVYDEEVFYKALEASCLIHDLKEFQNKEDTIIGERGINISGGQKARISLARAIYSEADIYLLDDPLSAVDP